ncbi:MAG: ParA family protein [Candidatus Saccharimonadales bacterium]
MATNIIAIANQKGGVGKTTTTINTAHYLAMAGKSVLVVDLDPQGNTTSGMGLDKHNLDKDLYHALHDFSVTHQILKTTPHNVSILPASPVLAAAEVELVNLDSREYRLKSVLNQLDFDYVLIDCPPSLGLLTINGLSAAEHVLIPVQAEYFALEGLGQLLQTIEMVKKGLNPNLDLLGVVLTMHAGRTTLSNQVHAEVHKHFPGQVFDEFIPRNVRLAEAPSYGQPIHLYDKRSKGAKAYKKFSKELMKRVDSKKGGKKNGGK